MASETKKEKWIVTREVSDPPLSEKAKKKESTRAPATLRESALSDIAMRLGESRTWDQKANNAFVYFALPTFTSFGMAFEKRMAQLVDTVNALIIACDCETQPCPNHIGRSIIIKGGIFENTNTLTQWFTNFFQQSPSINGLARENQVEIAKAGYSQMALASYQMTPTQIDLNE